MSIDRKEAKREFKERKTTKGVFSVRCEALSQTWVGCSANLEAARTGLFFALRNGLHQDRVLQGAWNQQGESGLEFQIVETFDEDLAPLQVKDMLRDRTREWKQKL